MNPTMWKTTFHLAVIGAAAVALAGCSSRDAQRAHQKYQDTFFGGSPDGGQPDRQRSDGPTTKTIECSSNQGKSNYCKTGGYGSVWLTKQLSQSPCVEYQTWGADGDGGGVWVRNGCHAVFALQGGGRPSRGRAPLTQR